MTETEPAPLEIPFITQGELTVLHIEPGDMVRIQLQQELTTDQRALLVEWWDEHVATVPALIMLPGETVDVVTTPECECRASASVRASFSESGGIA